MDVGVISWNLFHGRDWPPERELRTWRSRLFRTTARGPSHAQVNRDVYDSFASVLATSEWDVALLQECPPRWAERLAIDCRAEPHLVLTSRNLPGLGGVQGALADWSPDLIASWEGGSNLTLVRPSHPSEPAIVDRQMHRLAIRPERRRMALTRLGSGLCVANLHASAARTGAERDLLEAARVASEWAAHSPLVLGGDFNLRPALSGSVFETLEHGYGLTAPTGPEVIDHLLAAGLEVVRSPQQWPPERREVPDPTATGGRTLPIRLSDHAPVEVRLRGA